MYCYKKAIDGLVCVTVTPTNHPSVVTMRYSMCLANPGLWVGWNPLARYAKCIRLLYYIEASSYIETFVSHVSSCVTSNNETRPFSDI